MIHSEELSLMTPKKWLYWWQRQWCWRWTWRFWLKLLQYTWEWGIFIDILSGIVSFFLYMDLLYSWSYMALTELPRKHVFWLLAQVKSCKMSAIFNPDSTGLWQKPQLKLRSKCLLGILRPTMNLRSFALGPWCEFSERRWTIGKA